jgi:hypothetical protein
MACARVCDLSISTFHEAFTGDYARSSSSEASTSLVVSLSACEIEQLRCLLATWDSSPIGSARFTTDLFGTERPHSSHSGTPLDS